MKKLNIKVILLQLLGMLLLINGILQLKFYTVAEKFVCATNNFHDQKSECWDRLFPEEKDFFNFWPSVYIWIFIGLIIGILQVAFLNWKNKFSALNTIIVAIVMYILIRLKFFRKGIVPRLFNSGGAAFSDDFQTQCLIGGIIFTFIGIAILWLATNPILFNFRKAKKSINS